MSERRSRKILKVFLLKNLNFNLMGHNLIEKFWYFKQFSANFHKKMIYSQKIIVSLQPILAIPIYWWKSDDNTKYCLTNKWKRFAESGIRTCDASGRSRFEAMTEKKNGQCSATELSRQSIRSGKYTLIIKVFKGCWSPTPLAVNKLGNL